MRVVIAYVVRFLKRSDGLSSPMPTVLRESTLAITPIFIVSDLSDDGITNCSS